MKRSVTAGSLWLLSLFFTACAGGSPERTGLSSLSDFEDAKKTITAEDLLKHTKTLASDEFEGRAPGSRGEELTTRYLIDEFTRLGLRPGNPDGTFIQKVPLVGFTGQPQGAFHSGSRRLDLQFPTDFVAVSRRFQPEVKVESSDMVFVGYGVVAPEFGWDDYKGVDVRGKTLVMLINDPAVPDPSDPARLDEKLFKGRAMTYYGRWTYKFEIATEKGAAAAVIIHETGPAGYPYEVVKASWGRENFDIQKPDRNAGRVGVESWISLDSARKLFALSGKNIEDLKKSALRRDFKPVPLNAKASFTIKNTLREIDSKNVIARLDGSDAKLAQEYVIYSAHWDHLGRDEKLDGDQIYNGALDNASGVAVLLELAKAYRRLGTPPKRSILFLAVTAEEKGLLGAKYYAENPLYPLARTVANINMDGVNQWGRTSDVVVIGLGNSTLDDVLTEVMQRHGRTIKPDAEPEKGFFYRSDHFEFAKQGVPALYTDSGTNFIGKSAEYSNQKRDEYTTKDYHKVSDEIKTDWDLSGAVEDTQVLLEVGYRVAQGDKIPEWKTGTEFKAKREEMLRGER